MIRWLRRFMSNILAAWVTLLAGMLLSNLIEDGVPAGELMAPRASDSSP